MVGKPIIAHSFSIAFMYSSLDPSIFKQIKSFCKFSCTCEYHRVELRVTSPRYDLISNYEHEGTAFYDVLDHVIDVMYRQLLEYKQKEIDERKQRGWHEEFKKER